MISLPTVMEEHFPMWGAQVHVKKTMESFFKRFLLTMDPILIVLLKHI